MSSTTAIVLAAGQGTRMESDLPKVLVPVCGRPMLHYVVDALRKAGVDRIIVVVGYKADLVRETFAGEDDIVFVEQTEQLGTGHAVMVCREELKGSEGPVFIVTGDSPMLQVSSVRTLLNEFAATQPACLLGTARHDDPTGLGRIVRDPHGKFIGIVEQKDATPEQAKITEVNMSTYLFAAPKLLSSLEALTTDNAQGEYYLTDCPSILLGLGEDVRALDALQPCESLSVNTVADLAVVEEEMKRQLKK